MNDKFSNMNPEDTEFADKLNTLSERTNLDPRFSNELKRKLKASHKPKTVWLTSPANSILPSLGWVALVVAAGLVLIWSIQNLIPAPQPGTNPTPSTQDVVQTSTPSPDNVIKNPTPIPQGEAYDWRQTKLYLSVPLPPSPADVKLYSFKAEQPATLDIVMALATQFGVHGEIYQTPSMLPGATGYLVTDGKQRLYVQSDLNFGYYADYGTYSYMNGSRNITDEQAATVIDAFMKSHGLDFPYHVENAQLNPGMYYVLPLTPDGLPIYQDYNLPARLEFTIDENGQVILITSYRVGYEAMDGTYGTISSEEAFQKILASSTTVQNGVLEITRSSGMSNSGFWSRAYPDNQTITIYGQPLSYPANTAGGAPFIAIGQFTAAGNIRGIENIDSSTYIEVTGQFVTENSIRRFNVDTWRITKAPESYLSGSLRREGDQTILTADDGSGVYIIDDAPADLPLNTNPGEEYLSVHGFMVNDKLCWDNIQFYPAGAGGSGGGGSGTSFYQLNLSGIPVPFPTTSSTANQGSNEYTVKSGDTLTAIAQNFGITVDELIQANGLTDTNIFVDQKLIIPGAEVQAQNPLVGRQFENQRGILIVNIYRKPDGSQRTEYNFITATDHENFYFTLNGTGLNELEKYHNRPVNLWFTITGADQFGSLTATVERFEVPFPDLTLQILKGRQKVANIQGKTVLTFVAENGTTYVQMGPSGDVFNERSIFATENDDVFVEGLAIPDETFAGYPTLRLYGVNYVVDPTSGQANEMTVTADQPYVTEETQDAGTYSPPAATIEEVELVYYVPTPTNPNADPNVTSVTQYVQPAWRFYGHYSNGDEFEFLVQALKQEFLLPDLDPSRPPG